MDEDKAKIMEEVTAKLAEMSEIDKLEGLLKSNFNEFQHKEKIYRMRWPNNFEKEEANKYRMKKYITMLQDPAYLFKAQWIMMLKEKGIDIEKLEQEAKTCFMRERELQKKLATTQDPADIKTLKASIEQEHNRQNEIFVQKEEHLKYCIETQLEDSVKFYLLFLILETKVEEKWEKVFKTYAEFEACEDDILLARAAQILAVIVYNGKV